VLELWASYDGEESYQHYNDNLLFGTYFFISDDRAEETRVVYSMVKMVSELGGLLSSLILLFGSIGNIVNTELFVSSLIHEL